MARSTTLSAKPFSTDHARRAAADRLLGCKFSCQEQAQFLVCVVSTSGSVLLCMTLPAGKNLPVG